MDHVLVNAANLTGAGGQAVGSSLLPALLQAMPDVSISLLLPDQPAYRALALPDSAHPTFLQRTGLASTSNDLRRMKELFMTAPHLARRVKADVCLTLGDFGPVHMPCPDVIFLHQALLVYDGDLRGLGEWPPLKRFYLTRHFQWTARHAARIVVQTPVMAERVIAKYSVDPERIVIIRQPVPRHVLVDPAEIKLHPLLASCEKPIKLLFLAGYGAHKNHAILPAVAEELRHRGLASEVHIFLTLDEANQGSARIRSRLQDYTDTITNLGPLPMNEVAGALYASTALFLPTLVESYGLIYLEAMTCGLPILTSDRDFAHWMCRDLAHYFDPFNAGSITDAIESLKDFNDAKAYRDAVNQHLVTFPGDWNEVAAQFVTTLRRAAQEGSCRSHG